jgi:hypothetical protein
MLRKPSPQQTALEMVSLDGLVPKDHLQDRRGGRLFVYPRPGCRSSLPDNGRASLDPTLMFKALFVGYLFGIRSERQLVREDRGVPFAKPKGGP